MPKFYYEDFVPGAVDTYGPRLVTREEIIAFAELYDPQPMHLSEEAGRASMLGGLAASGWGSCAMLMRMICDWFMLDSACCGAPGVDEVKWMKPVRPGDQISLRRTILAKRVFKSRPEIGLVTFFYEMINQNGEIVLTMQTPVMFSLRHPQTAGAA